MPDGSIDLVYLLIGEDDHAHGEVMFRSNIPSDSYRAPGTVRHSAVADLNASDNDADLEVWVVPR